MHLNKLVMRGWNCIGIKFIRFWTGVVRNHKGPWRGQFKVTLSRTVFAIFQFIKTLYISLGKGQNYKNHNIINVSKHRNIKKCLFSSSLLQHQNVKSVFLVHHYYDNQNIKNNIEIDFWCSDFTYGVKKDQNVENKKHQLPMAYYLWLPRPVGG
jgi:hypothetical protein